MSCMHSKPSRTTLARQAPRSSSARPDMSLFRDLHGCLFDTLHYAGVVSRGSFSDTNQFYRVRHRPVSPARESTLPDGVRSIRTLLSPSLARPHQSASCHFAIICVNFIIMNERSFSQVSSGANVFEPWCVQHRLVRPISDPAQTHNPGPAFNRGYSEWALLRLGCFGSFSTAC
jgi:hypothetical protein